MNGGNGVVPPPAGWIAPEKLQDLLQTTLARLYIFVLISLPLFHWAHRFRFVVVDLGLKGMGRLPAIICYGTAIVATPMAGWFLILR